MLRVNNKLWIISDTHFGHQNIIKYQQRPTNHEVIMASEWVYAVRPEDQILHLGDVFMGKGGNPARWAAIVSCLPGEKFLIKGNHDKQKDAFYEKSGFTIIEPFIHEGFVFSHEPVCEYLLPDSKDPTVRRRFPKGIETAWWHTNIHGHTHNNPPEEGLLEGKTYINCCVEVTDLKPRQLGNIWSEECAEQLTDENSPLYLAMFGPQGATLDDECFLVCGESQDMPSWYRSTHELKAIPCDGKCGKELSVSKRDCRPDARSGSRLGACARSEPA